MSAISGDLSPFRVLISHGRHGLLFVERTVHHVVSAKPLDGGRRRPVKWSCRTGVCHTCETGLILGALAYMPDPLDPPAEGTALICCSQPRGSDIVIDL
jgi:ferredoxin